MKAIFRVNFNQETNTLDLPPIQSESAHDLQLEFTDTDGVVKGGYTCLTTIPADTVDVEVTASKSVIDAMKADTRYEWLNDILEEQKSP